MQAVFQILTELGLNFTVLYQMGLFFVAYFFLSQFLFKPYVRNLEYRRGFLGLAGTGGAAEIQSQIEKLNQEYQDKLRSENEKTQNIFNKYKNDALAESESTLSAARAKSSKLIDDAKIQIQSEVKAARESLSAQIPQISALVAGKILGRELK